MHIILTICSAVILSLGVLLFLDVRKRCEEAHGWFLKSEALGIRLRAERDRVTVLERDSEALRRELGLPR